jgi:hypothetical protein
VAERLQSQGLFEDGDELRAVNFLETRQAKVATIAQLGCEVFVDDLPEVLNAPSFPSSTKGILFGTPDPESRCLSASTWIALLQIMGNLSETSGR